MKKITSRLIKRIFLGLLIILTILIVMYWDLVSYGIQQGYGQATIIWNARPVEDFITDPTFPDSLKARLKLIDEVRQYAIDSLGMKDTKNYKTLYDQKGEELMWVVLASEEFQLKHKEWKFPIIGAVPYKGFFNKKKAITLREELESEGYDVIIRNPGGWSTLGWFTDPILSKMLNRSEGDLANLIIHEMSHATIFVKDSIDFNENLATFIGDRGAEKFMIHKYGSHAKEYRNYIEEDEDYLKFVNHMLSGAKQLDSLYGTMKEIEPIERKRSIKKSLIQKIVMSMDTLSLMLTKQPSKRFKNALPNNAYFMNFRTYQSKQIIFLEDFKSNYKSDLQFYIKVLSEKYPFL